MSMKCIKCGGNLEVLRMCGAVNMRCTDCSRRFAIHEVIDQLDEEAEAQLERYNAIIYD
jgi:DNA-directed RNA polymerase subunit RPC12/RpoP